MLVSNVLGAGTSALLAQAIGGVGSNVVALGTNQATATPLGSSLAYLTAAAAGTGIKLPPAEMGNDVWLFNNSGQTINIYPFELSGTTFNAASPTLTIANGKGMLLKCPIAGVWISLLTA